jgi:hypothetical protein
MNIHCRITILLLSMRCTRTPPFHHMKKQFEAARDDSIFSAQSNSSCNNNFFIRLESRFDLRGFLTTTNFKFAFTLWRMTERRRDFKFTFQAQLGDKSGHGSSSQGKVLNGMNGMCIARLVSKKDSQEIIVIDTYIHMLICVTKEGSKIEYMENELCVWMCVYI